jgi:hypothetical protein
MIPANGIPVTTVLVDFKAGRRAKSYWQGIGKRGVWIGRRGHRFYSEQQYTPVDAPRPFNPGVRCSHAEHAEDGSSLTHRG